MISSSSLKATSPLSEWLSYLEQSHFKTIDLGLERVKAVAQDLDLLQPAPFVITVGGTNGKGTTCRLLEVILINAGYRVGVYSSPHLLRYNERVRIQNQELVDEEHTASFAFIDANKTQSLTYFEFTTLSALHLFKQAKLDIVILEVGLGGRLDATNIVDSDIAVVTSINIDHVDFLGDTREKIAFEKAGIFRPNKVAVVGEPDVPQTLLDYAAQLSCSIFRRGIDWTFHQENETWSWQSQHCQFENLPMCKIPLANAATALAVIEKLPFPIPEQVIRQSLCEVELNGRFQLIKNTRQLEALATLVQKNPQNLPRFYLDVGHNPHAACYLAQCLQKVKSQMSGKIIAVCGILKDKDAHGIFAPLLEVVDEWQLVTLEGPRGQTGQQLFVTLQQFHSLIRGQSANSVMCGVKNALQRATERDVIIVFGSFHTVGEFLEGVS